MHLRASLTVPFCTLVVSLFLFSPHAAAQPDWVKQSVAGAVSQHYHADAAIVTLHKSEDVTIKSDGRALSHVRIAYKVLKADGLTEAALSEGVYVWRKVEDISGWHILPTGKKEQLTASQIATVAPHFLAGFYDDAHLLVAGFTTTVVNSVVAFEYDVIEDKDWVGTYQTFIVQRQQPVLFAQYKLRLPARWRLLHSGRFIDSVRVDSTNGEYVWTATQLPYRQDEPLMPSWAYLTRRLEVACYPIDSTQGAAGFSSWNQAARWTSDLHLLPSQPNAQVYDFVEQRLEAPAFLADKLDSIASFVQNDVRYVAVEIGKGRLIPRHSSATLTNRYGDCKDKVALMRAMLTAVKIPSATVLAAIDAPVYSNLPTPFQFNHCIVAIPTASLANSQTFAHAAADKWLFFDPTEPTARIGHLPLHLYGSSVLVASEQDSALIKLPELVPEENVRTYAAQAKLEPDGSLIANVRITDIGTMAMAVQHYRSTTPVDEILDSLRKHISSTVPGAVIQNYEIGAGGDSAWATFTLRGKDYAQKAGELNVIKLDFLQPAEKAAFKSADRALPVWFGPPSATQTVIDWDFGGRWIYDTPLDSVTATCEIARASARIEPTTGGIHYTSSSLEFGHLLWPEKYPEARAYRKDYERLTALKAIVHTK